MILFFRSRTKYRFIRPCLRNRKRETNDPSILQPKTRRLIPPSLRCSFGELIASLICYGIRPIHVFEDIYEYSYRWNWQFSCVEQNLRGVQKSLVLWANREGSQKCTACCSYFTITFWVHAMANEQPRERASHTIIIIISSFIKSEVPRDDRMAGNSDSPPLPIVCSQNDPTKEGEEEEDCLSQSKYGTH